MLTELSVSVLLINKKSINCLLSLCYQVLNLFLALLINAFGSDQLDKHKESAKESNRIGLAIKRLKHLFCCCCPFVKKNTINPSKNGFEMPDPLVVSTIPEEDGEGEGKGGIADLSLSLSLSSSSSLSLTL
jgi:hypothetical protein